MKNPEEQKWPLVYIEWIDATSSSGWHDEEEIEDFAECPCIVREVGFLYRETKDQIILFMRWGKGQFAGNATFRREISYGNVQQIPKPWIIKRIDLKVEV